MSYSSTSFIFSEVKFGFTKKTPFSVGVYLLDQHISGSPAYIDPEKDIQDKATSVSIDQFSFLSNFVIV